MWGVALLVAGHAYAADPLAAAGSAVGSGDYAAALTDLQQLHGAQAAGVTARFLRGTALAGKGELDRAAAVFKKLIADYPKLPEPYNNLAAIYAREGRLADAKDLLERGLHTDQRYATIYENLSAIYVQMARASYAKALRIKSAGQLPPLHVLSALATAPVAPAPIKVASAAPPAPPPVKPAPPAAPPVATPPAPPAPAKVAPAAAPPAKPANGGAAARQAVAGVLQGWATAWSQQDVAAYLADYAADYAPAGMSHDAWVQERHSRLTRPAWIKVSLSGIDVRLNAPGRATATLTQHYTAANYRDVTLKRLTLALRNGNWKITSERTLKVMH